MDRGERLFSKYDIHAALRAAPQALIERIGELPDRDILTDDPDALIDRLVNEFAVRVPILNVEATRTSQREIDIDVRGDQRRMIFDNSQPVLVAFTEVSFRVPFTGDRDAFRCRPSTFELTGEYADIEDDAIIIRIAREGHDGPAFRAAFDKAIEGIDRSLSCLRSDCKSQEDTLRETAKTHVMRRREKRQKDRGLLDDLGFERDDG